MLRLTILLALAACGDDSAIVADGGPGDSGAIDAPQIPDAGPADAGPPPRVELCDPAHVPGPYPAPDAWPANRGPGGPTRTFTTDELYVNCAYLDGGEGDTFDHHNLVTMYDGYLLMPWSPEFGTGGLTLWDISDPCAPVQTGYGFSEHMRETHSIGFSTLGGRWAVVNYLDLPLVVGGSGIELWDLSDTSAPRPVAGMGFPTTIYPAAYERVSLSVFWQVPYVYVATADLGLFIVDAADPESPVMVGQYQLEPIIRAGQVQVVGDLLVVTAAEGARTVLLDVSDPESPQEIPGGDFDALDAAGASREAYFTNVGGGYVWYAPKENGGGLTVMDIHDPTAPAFAGEIVSEGNGGYVFVKEGRAFVGESSFATVYDVSDLPNITEIARFDLVGDLDTITPIGNVAVLSVDEMAEDDRASAVAPWATEPDMTPPAVTWVWPPDASTELAPTSRIGVTFSEFVDPASAWEGSVRLYETGMDPDATRVDGVVSAQEVVVNFHPFCPLVPGRSYTLEIPAGGVVDFSGNAIAEPFTATFTVAGL